MLPCRGSTWCLSVHKGLHCAFKTTDLFTIGQLTCWKLKQLGVRALSNGHTLHEQIADQLGSKGCIGSKIIEQPAFFLYMYVSSRQHSSNAQGQLSLVATQHKHHVTHSPNMQACWLRIASQHDCIEQWVYIKILKYWKLTILIS